MIKSASKKGKTEKNECLHPKSSVAECEVIGLNVPIQDVKFFVYFRSRLLRDETTFSTLNELDKASAAESGRD